MKKLLNKDEIRYKKEKVKLEAKQQEEYSQGSIIFWSKDKGIPGSYLRK